MTGETDVFVGLAEIAGVFVGFGALIGFTRRGEIDPTELGYLRAVVTVGLLVVTGSLVPIGLSLFGVGERVLWLTSSAVLLTLIWFVIVVSLRAAGSREQMLVPVRDHPATTAFFLLVLELAVQVPLILVVLGIFAAQAPALYTMALIVNLLEAALVLAVVVFRQPPAKPS